MKRTPTATGEVITFDKANEMEPKADFANKKFVKDVLIFNKMKKHSAKYFADPVGAVVSRMWRVNGKSTDKKPGKDDFKESELNDKETA